MAIKLGIIEEFKGSPPSCANDVFCKMSRLAKLPCEQAGYWCCYWCPAFYECVACCGMQPFIEIMEE